MKVIFTDNVNGVAYKGDVKAVKDGYYRNFLQPNHKAIPATTGNLREWEELRKGLMIQKEQLKAKLEETQKRLSAGALTIHKKVTAKGTLYGGVKASDIVTAIAEMLKLEIPVGAVEMPEQIKKLGTYTLKLNLGEGVQANLPIEVVEKK